MLSEELPGQIERLVDHLRKNRDDQLSLTDVASVTEVLIGTMQAFFGSIDTSIYKECKSLSEYIANARTEIATLSNSEDAPEDSGIDRAGLELDAIVQATEEATNTIMNAAEEIMGADLSSDEGQASVQDAVMEIFEACSFQDITGQRISKVVETFTHIEARVAELSSLLGVSESDILRAKSEAPAKEGDAALLSGPALAGEGIDQSAVDDLLNFPDATSEPHAASEDVPQTTDDGLIIGTKKKAVPSPLIDSQEDIDALMAASPLPELAPEPEQEPEVKTKTKAKPKPAPAPAQEDLIEKSETTSQEDIDALFS